MCDLKIATAALALLLALSAMPAHSDPPRDAALNIEAVVAKVGEKQITREDVIHTMQIEKFYQSPALSEADALFIVMQDAIVHEVAHSVGVDVSPKETPVKFPFVDQYTPRGEEDKKAQGTAPLQDQAFHVDQSAYAQLYVVPKIINRKLRRYYSTSSFLHSSARASIKQALQLATSGKSMAEAAKASGLKAARHELENKPIIVSAARLPNLRVDQHIPQTNTLFGILDKLTPGAVHPDIVEDEDDYRVLRLIARNGQKYTIETIDAAKLPFETWLKERARSLRITISDDVLKRDVKRDYSGIDWVGRL